MRKCGLFRRAERRDRQMQELFDELGSLRAALSAAYMRFDTATEPELVDACVYEINAAQSRYNYQLRLIKESAGEAALRGCEREGETAWA